jgi:hypothetical protein
MSKSNKQAEFVAIELLVNSSLDRVGETTVNDKFIHTQNVDNTRRCHKIFLCSTSAEFGFAKFGQDSVRDKGPPKRS